MTRPEQTRLGHVFYELGQIEDRLRLYFSTKLSRSAINRMERDRLIIRLRFLVDMLEKQAAEERADMDRAA